MLVWVIGRIPREVVGSSAADDTSACQVLLDGGDGMAGSFEGAFVFVPMMTMSFFPSKSAIVLWVRTRDREAVYLCSALKIPCGMACRVESSNDMKKK